MLTGLRINQQLKKGYGPDKVAFVLDPYSPSRGPIRSMQKFSVILLTTIGTDRLRPWFGTKLNMACRMNVIDSARMRIFIQDQVSSAINQFFRLQEEDKVRTNAEDYDLIQSIELVGISVNKFNQYSLDVLFTPINSNSLIYSISLKESDNNATDLANYTIVEYEEWKRNHTGEE